MKCMAVACVAKGEVRLKEVEVADPKDNEVQIRLHYSVISQGTERAFILNLENATPAKYPIYPGYSIAGVVEKVGKNVTRFKPGDQVTSRGLNHRTIGNTNEQNVTRVPDNVPLDEAAFSTMGGISMQGVRKLRIELGESAMGLGLGLIGQLAVQLARLNGALPAIGVDRVQSRLDIAKAGGAHAAINSTGERWMNELWEATDGLGPHVVIESTGSPDAIEVAFDAVRPNGRVVLLGSTRGVSTVNFYKYVHDKGITIIGAHTYSNPFHDSRPGFWTWKDDSSTFMRLLEHKLVNVQPLITHQADWHQAEQMYEQVLAWNSDMMGVVLKWQ